MSYVVVCAHRLCVNLINVGTQPHAVRSPAPPQLLCQAHEHIPFLAVLVFASSRDGSEVLDEKGLGGALEG